RTTNRSPWRLLVAPAGLLPWLLLCTCHKGGGETIDAPVMEPDGGMTGPCWPADGTQPRGTIELGTGTTTYMSMPGQLELEYGTQGGFDIQVNAKMSGLQPGNPAVILDPSNPRTRFRGFYVDTGGPINNGLCPFRLGYVPAGGDMYVFPMGARLLYDVCF